jgi:hypothetical protein
MRNSKMRTAILNGAGRGLAERGGAIRRQRAQGNVPTLILQPFLDVAAGARYFERLIVILQEDDVIGQATETAEHDIFIAGQALARP